jgi:hypothetical protein
MAQAFSALIALVTAFVAAPLIAWYTKGKYYLARRRTAAGLFTGLQHCTICEREYESDDMAHCPPTSATSARCAARSTRAATTCASPRRAGRRSGRPLRGAAAARRWAR